MHNRRCYSFAPFRMYLLVLFSSREIALVKTDYIESAERSPLIYTSTSTLICYASPSSWRPCVFVQPSSHFVLRSNGSDNNIKTFASQEIFALFYVLQRAQDGNKGFIHINYRNYSTVFRLPGSRFRIPLRDWMFLSCICCVLCR
jgi:hypothetical protein